MSIKHSKVYAAMELGEFIDKVYDISSSPTHILELLRKASLLLVQSYKTLKFRPPGFYEILDYDELYAIGDLHGDFGTLAGFLASVLPRLDSGNAKVVFLGDYIDRGGEQLEVLLSALLLKTLYPEKVVLLRGNHEPPAFLLPYPHDFPKVLFLRFGGKANVMYSLFLSFFQKLGYGARVPGQFLFLHGGPPTTVLGARSFEEAFSVGKPCVDDMGLEEVLWSDPVEGIGEPYTVSPRGAGVLYGEIITRKALALSSVSYIIRGHEAVNGYKLSHKGAVVTLFSSKIPYGLERAGYLYVRRDSSIEDLVRCCIKTI